jgi:hypothetical protein
MNFPVIGSGELPEGLRMDLVRNDLAHIAALAEEQVRVHEYATQAATEVLHSSVTADVPNKEDLFALKERYEQPNAMDEIFSASGLARQMVTRRDADAGIAGRDITHDVLSELHPDRDAEGVNDTTSEDIFKSITGARLHGDGVLEQGLYAGTVAQRASRIESPTAAKLERIRYKAWLALQAGKGRFDSAEEVDAWKEHELELVPVKARAGLLMTTAELFAQSLGTDDSGRIRVPSECHASVSEGFRVVGRVFRDTFGDEAAPDVLSDMSMGLFDRDLTRLVKQLQGLYTSQAVIGRHMWNQYRIAIVNQVGELLADAARHLEKPTLSFSLGSLALAGLRYPDARRRSILPKDDDPYAYKELGKRILNIDDYPSEEFGKY